MRRGRCRRTFEAPTTCASYGRTTIEAAIPAARCRRSCRRTVDDCWCARHKSIMTTNRVIVLMSVVAVLLVESAAMRTSGQQPPKYPALPSETPAKLAPMTDGFDYVRRDVMIPMRDGVKLHTVILVPKGATGAPILLTRTPYDATKLTSHAESAHLGPVLQGYDNATDVIVEGGYIRAVQDVRSKHGSEGAYVV